MNSTPVELIQQQSALQGSPQAYVGGIFFAFTLTSSLFHLVYMGGERLYAILKPIHYKWQTKTSVYVGLGVVWFLSFLSATVPGKHRIFKELLIVLRIKGKFKQLRLLQLLLCSFLCYLFLSLVPHSVAFLLFGTDFAVSTCHHKQCFKHGLLSCYCLYDNILPFTIYVACKLLG